MSPFAEETGIPRNIHSRRVPCLVPGAPSTDQPHWSLSSAAILAEDRAWKAVVSCETVLVRRRLLSEIESEPILLGEDSARELVLTTLIHLKSPRRRDIRVENGLTGTSSHVITSTYGPGKTRRDKVLPYLKVT
ncbi:jg2135 [Pararge aegeria aegeria]|uniref:Jg2135 protein n=1 Tax=Pararge aegeria aegeria TaxID=348720 RepID=A0A8S4RUH9_9NEOP|nr:jg2135 [Pararge aegeria aegeria]